METRDVICMFIEKHASVQSFLWQTFRLRIVSVSGKQNQENRLNPVKTHEQDQERNETLSTGASKNETVWKSLTVALITDQFLAQCWELKTYLVVVIELGWTDIAVSQSTHNNSSAEVHLSY